MAELRPSAAVSVVLCTYNGAAYLEEQLASIAEQTLLPAELIVCDDGSTDATLDILEAFRRHAPFAVSVFRNSHQLRSTGNFDQAMQRASGTLLALSDQDDRWLPHKLATLVPILKNDPSLGGVFSDAFLLEDGVSGNTNSGTRTIWGVHGFTARKQQAFMMPGGATARLLQHDIVTGATMLVRTELRSLWHPIPSSWVHDAWMAWMLSVYSRLVPVAEPLMMYRVHREQQIGLGTKTVMDKIRSARSSERMRYLRVADQFEALLERVQRSGCDPDLELKIQEKITLLRWRAELPHQWLRRAVSIAREAHEYQRYARGWRSMRKDLFLS